MRSVCSSAYTNVKSYNIKCENIKTAAYGARLKPVKVGACLNSAFDREITEDSTALEVESTKADSPSPTRDMDIEGSYSDNTLAVDASSTTGTRPLVEDETTVVIGGKEGVG